MHGIPKTLAILASLFVGLSQAADPPASPIILPIVEQKKELTPTPPPGTPLVLAPDSMYVIQSPVECLLFTSPGSGSVKVTKDAGPLRIKGRFAEKPYEIQTKNFTAKFLYIVESVKQGKDELIIVPVGAKAESEAQRVTFQVGTAPQPPPIDDPVVTGKLAGWVLIEETSKPFLNRGAILTIGIQWSKENGIGHRVADQHVKDSTGQTPADLSTYVADAVRVGVPQLYLMSTDGKKLYQGSVPATSDEFINLLKKYKGN